MGNEGRYVGKCSAKGAEAGYFYNCRGEGVGLIDREIERMEDQRLGGMDSTCFGCELTRGLWTQRIDEQRVHLTACLSYYVWKPF